MQNVDNKSVFLGRSRRAKAWAKHIIVILIVLFLCHQYLFASTVNADAYEIPRDIAVKKVSVYPSETTAGTTVEIRVLVKNFGDVTEVFNLTAYYDDILFYEIENITLKGHKASWISFPWNTKDLPSGTYVILVVVSTIPELEIGGSELDTMNNIGYATVILTSTVVHDVRIADVMVSPTHANVGDLLTVEVTVTNDGTVTENFTVTVLFDLGVIGTAALMDVHAAETKIANLTWNTTGISPGNYNVTALASIVANETDTTNNILIYTDVNIEKMVSSITLTAAPPDFTLGASTLLSGSISPHRDGITITIFYRSTLGDWKILATSLTNETGSYSFMWTSSSLGSFDLKASWLGDVYTEPAESSIQKVTVSTPLALPPMVSFTCEPIAPVVGDTVTFNASVSYDSDGTIVNYAWDFGDDTFDLGMIATHIYNAVGKYDVTLTITDNDGLSSTETKSIIVTVKGTDTDPLTGTNNLLYLLLGACVALVMAFLILRPRAKV